MWMADLETNECIRIPVVNCEIPVNCEEHDLYKIECFF